MEVFDVSKSAEKEEETESVKDDLEVTNILKTNDKTFRLTPQQQVRVIPESPIVTKLDIV